MKKAILGLIISMLILSSCGDFAENIEVSDLNTQASTSAKRVAAKEVETTSSENADNTTNKQEDSSNIENTSSILDNEQGTTIETTMKESSLESVTISSNDSEASTEKPLNSQQSNEIDIDISVMNQTMAYSQIYSMMMNPNDYIGKTVKVAGEYNTGEDQGNTYHFIVVIDEGACCSMGMEIKLDEGIAYPVEASKATVTGVFKSYDEEGQTWYYLQAYKLD